ncbi:unnamed protein product, partial [Meganyctiphanes norvegica]
MVPFMCFVVLVSAVPGTLADCDSVVSNTGGWNGGWQGKFDVPVTNNVNGWTLKVNFDSPISEFEQWSVNTVSSGSRSVTLGGIQYWNDNLVAGSTLSFDFLYRFSGNQIPKINSVEFNGQNVCGGSNAGSQVTEAPEPTTEAGPVVPAVTADPSSAVSKCNAKYDYDEALEKSLLFYEAQRSGPLPEDQRVTWRKDSGVNDHGFHNGKKVDLSGGYYDAGDFVKFGFPMAGTATILAWGAIDYKGAYTNAGELDNVKSSVKFATDWFLKAHVSPNVLFGQVGNGKLDHDSWGRPEDMTMARPAYKIDTNNPGSDLAGETAAALAAASILFDGSDPEYSAECLKSAKELYKFANKYRGKYSDAITDAAIYYKSWGGYNDELAWAAAWLYRATNETKYLTQAESHYKKLVTPNEFSWDDKTAGVQVLLAKLTNKNKYKTATKAFCDDVINNKQRTPKGLVFFAKWGPLRYSANAAYICLQAADLGLKPSAYRSFACKQIHYMLGDAGRSFLIGFGKNYPQRPHHRSSSCPTTGTCDWNSYKVNGPNPQLLVGALVGGPDAYDNYNDDRDDYLANEVTTDYNAGFQSAVAALRQT